MARRATVIEQKRALETSQLLVDCGDFVQGKGVSSLLKAEYLAMAMSRMGYDAVNIGREEVILGADQILELRDRQRLPLVSTNLLRRDDRRQLVLPYVIKRVGAKQFLGFQHGGIKVALLGLTTEGGKDPMKRLIPRELQVVDILEVLASTMQKLRTHCDLMVVLSDLDLETAKGLAQGVGGIDLFFIGAGAQAKYAEKIAGTIFVYPARKGDEIGDIQLSLGENKDVVSFEVEWTLLDDKIPDDPEMIRLIEEFKEAQKESRRIPTDLKK